MTDLLKKAKQQMSKRDKTKSKNMDNAKNKPNGEPKKEKVQFSKFALDEKTDPRKSPDTNTKKDNNEPAEQKKDIKMEMSSVSAKDATKVYADAIEATKKIFNDYRNDNPVDRKDVVNVCQDILDCMAMNPGVLLKLFHEMDSQEDYMFHNAVNVSILSVELGMSCKYNKSRLLDLAIIGLLHDMDLIKNKEVIEKKGKLDESELKEIERHSLNTAAYVDHAFNFSKDIVNAILQHHERKKGQGYPTGLEEHDIQDLAEIVGIADTYEAMTHSRPYKEKVDAYNAIMNIVSHAKNLFSNNIIKMLVNCVGLYPITSWVELNTGEKCRVEAVNPSTPLRPVVTVLIDKEGKKYNEPRTIDLKKTSSLYIKNIIEHEKVESK